MKWLGRYGWALTLAVAIGVPVLAYLMFEKWFLVPLPKGPIEDLLGLLTRFRNAEGSGSRQRMRQDKKA